MELEMSTRTFGDRPLSTVGGRGGYSERGVGPHRTGLWMSSRELQECGLLTVCTKT